MLLPEVQVLERGWLSSNNVLLFDSDTEATLVDTGYVSHSAQTVELVRRSLDGRRLARVINTHLHSDHCGGNAALKRAFGSTIWIPPGQAEAVTAWDAEKLSFEATGQRCDRFAFDGLLRPGESVRLGKRDWNVLSAPGHDPNSIILWNPAERVLISADALWENGFGAIFGEVEGESAFGEQRAILKVIEHLGPTLVIPGHGAAFTDSTAALRRAHARLDALEADPVRNARHVAKVLIKFFLLDVRSVDRKVLIDHFGNARYFQLINDRYFRRSLPEFVEAMANELSAGGAAAWVGDRLENRD